MLSFQNDSSERSKPVVVLETSNRVELALARGLLEDAEIPVFVQGQITTLIQDIDPFLRKQLRLEVPGDFETEARKVLEQLAAD